MSRPVGVHQRADGSVVVTVMAPVRLTLGGLALPWTRAATRAELEAELTRLQALPAHPCADLPWMVLDASALPPRWADCPDCGEQHPARDRWRTDGARVWIEPSVRWHHAEVRHLEQTIAAETDPLRVAALVGAILAYGRWWRGIAADPPPERVIRRLTRRLRPVA